MYMKIDKSLLAATLKVTVVVSLLMLSSRMQAQLSSNPDKFLGNITTSYNVDYGNEKFYTLWNQITCENESKWASVEGNNNNFNWGGCDNAVNYAKNHGFPFKFHALVWGSQYPSWIESMTPEQRYKEVVQWMDAVKARYPDLQLIDVVNEAVSGHQGGTHFFSEALGGAGETGYDWIIKAFELAYERWPNAILIYNDFNTFQWNTDQYIDLVKTLRNAGAPVDAYGCQSHDLTDCSLTNFKSAMIKLQNALKMPMYSTEYDIGTTSDALQLQRYKEQIPYMWEADYCAGITLWGYIYGKTWTTDGNSGIIKNGVDRPAMTWLREYMATDAAKKAKSPFPGMKKEASVYIKPSALNVEKNTPTTVLVRAKMRTKQIEKVELYAKNVLVATMTEAPYVAEYTPTTTGQAELKAVVTTTDGETYTRYGMVNVCNPRAPFKGTPTVLPGVLQAENFDTGADGVAFHDMNGTKQGTGSSYRSDVGGIDIEKGGSGYVVGYTEVGEWMEYTVDVKEAGVYSYDISYSAPEDNPTINIALNKAGVLTPMTPEKTVLMKTGDWNTYKTAHGRLLLPLEAGQQIVRLSIVGGTGDYVINLDYVDFKKVDVIEDLTLSLDNVPGTGMLTVPITITPEITGSSAIKSVKYYVDGFLSKTFMVAPYTMEFTPTEMRTYNIMAVATDANGKQSNLAQKSIVVGPLHAPYVEMPVPGIIEAENFDRGEEGVSYHDSDAVDEGKANYRTDNGGVDIIKTADGYGIGYTVSGEWLEYTVDVKETGKYYLKSTVDCSTSGGLLVVSDVTDGSDVTLWNVRLGKDNTMSKGDYKVVVTAMQRELTAGKHVLRLLFKTGGFDLDRVEIVRAEDSGIDEMVSLSECEYVVYTLSGACVTKIKANGSRDLIGKIADVTGKAGVYVVKNAMNGSSMKILVK